MKFYWDAKKAKHNVIKHGVSFEEAATVFLDTLSMTGADPDHSFGEERWLTFGISVKGRFLVIAHLDDGENIRIISARLGNKSERNLYEQTHI